MPGYDTPPRATVSQMQVSIQRNALAHLRAGKRDTSSIVAE
jgi:hypothetical protein